MKRYGDRVTVLILALVAMFAVNAHARTVDEIPNVHADNRTRYVSDPDGYLSTEGIAHADAIIDSIWNATTAEPVVVIVKDMNGRDIDSYATSLFEKWRLGKSDRDNGLLMLISVDDRKGVIRTGYGVEGVLPDITCGRIIRNIMAPAMKGNDYDAAVINSLEAIKTVLQDPAAAEELMSKHANNEGAGSNEGFTLGDYLRLGVYAAIIMLVITVVSVIRSRKLDRSVRVERLQKKNVVFLMLTIGFCGVPVLAYLIYYLVKRNIRRSPIRCSNCNHKMRLVDEVHDNDYLTPSQDLEEQLGSVDYDVWHCDSCGNNEIYPFVNLTKQYTVCPKCGARTEELLSTDVVQQPTITANGKGVNRMYCKNCHNRRDNYFSIPKKMAEAAAAAAIIGAAAAGSRGRGGGFGGGFSGGSFGGGHTGGGGASGGW